MKCANPECHELHEELLEEDNEFRPWPVWMDRTVFFLLGAVTAGVIFILMLFLMPLPAGADETDGCTIGIAPEVQTIHCTPRFHLPTEPPSPVLTNTLKGIAIAEIGGDMLETRAFLARGVCHEIDPLASTFVHSTVGDVAVTAGLAYLISKLHNNRATNIGLAVGIVAEGFNIARNVRDRCD
jgi:hypothetical protein